MGLKDGAGRNAAVSGMGSLLVSALAFSTAGVFARMAPVPIAAMVFWRNGFGCFGLVLLLAWRHETAGASSGHGRARAAVIACSALATVCYLAAFAYTSVAHIAIIYAAAPLLTAGLAWLCLGERPEKRTLAAAAAALLGVATAVGGSATAGSLVGDGLALLMTILLSGVAVVGRNAALPPLSTSLASALLAAVAVVPVAFATGSSLAIDGRDALWLAAFGIVTMTVALPTYLMGIARIPAGRAMLISAVEMPFGPFWVWVAFGETPDGFTLAGAAIVLVAVLTDIWGGRRRDIGCNPQLAIEPGG